ncbi:cryptochrome/photolyase family protein [Rhodotorula paludigena]|uniref:cryptochrome/photolyase family protein n=1 Tax=Rhodotorula paludigena TaxID=86838 RepID=UPI00317EA96A
MTAAKRTRSSTSADTAASTSQPSAAPASKRSRRSPSKEEKPRIKPDPEEEDDEGHDPRFDSPPAILARAAREETFPAEMDQTPLAKLYDAMHAFAKTENKSEVKPNKDGCVVYWSRNKDLRLDDNTALSYASAIAQDLKLPLLYLHIFSIGDYKSHDRSPRRIDFQLRQLAYLRKRLHDLDIPLLTLTQESRRKDIPRLLCEKLEEWGAVGLYANLEYEVDELRRDTEILERTREAREKGEGWRGKVEFFKDFCIISPGELTTKQGKPYSVYSPYQRAWSEKINSHLVDYVVQHNGPVIANDPSTRKHPVLGSMFDHEIPTAIAGFELEGGEKEAKVMRHLWPVGDGITEGIMDRFMKTKLRPAKFFDPPLEGDAEEVADPKKDSKIGQYREGRNRVDWDGTSHISAYLAAGFISPRDCIRRAYEISGGRELPGGRDTGIGMWCQEVAWRDFYNHVLATWPRVSMAKPFNLKYDETIEWATDDDDKKFQAWVDGKTGFPIVDAAMRALKREGYMHNRCRMIVASFLTKDLLIDWRKGEKYFMQQLLDGDLASNNGGWQWCASTGTDPQPYFRIFNPASQSEKVDPSGEYIRHWLPELKSIKGKAIHDPSKTMSKKQLDNLGYCMPIVDHSKARTKAIEAYKTAAASA